MSKNILVFKKYTQKCLGMKEHYIYNLLSNDLEKSTQRENGKVNMVNVNIWGIWYTEIIFFWIVFVFVCLFCNFSVSLELF